jgi:hypothetical protein
MQGKLAATLVVGIALGLATAFIARQPEAQAQEKAKTELWEYSVYSTRGRDPIAIAGEINSNLAAKGWDYVGPIWQTKDGSFVLFRRPKK